MAQVQAIASGEAPGGIPASASPPLGTLAGSQSGQAMKVVGKEVISGHAPTRGEASAGRGRLCAPCGALQESGAESTAMCGMRPTSTTAAPASQRSSLSSGLSASHRVARSPESCCARPRLRWSCCTP